MADPPRQAAGLRSLPTAGSGAPAEALPAPEDAQAPAGAIPERYAIRDKEGARYLECDEAPRLRAVIDPSMSASKSEAAALGDGVILLDGAGSFGPSLDNDRRVYNLDHHWGCERLFTLSTCEQALLLVHGGLELGEGDWTIYANDPDLDTCLALWCLLNHRRLRELRPEARDVLLPLLRLEGAIDSNGRELAQLCGLPTQVLEETQQRIDELLAGERALKQSGGWAKKDVYAHTLEVLSTIDAMVYLDEDFGDYARVEEIYGHVEIAPRRVAVVCRDRSGIYTVEQHLKTRWGDQLSVIALENQPGHYTLRRVSSLSGPDLRPAYALLNRIDPAVDGEPPGKRWGGSNDIGGSPRPRGTQLASSEVIEILARAYRDHSSWSRLGRSAGAFALGVAFAAFWPLASALPSVAEVLDARPPLAAAYRVGLAALLAAGVGLLASRVASKGRLWVLGYRAPAPGSWWWLAPAVPLLAVAAPGWLPRPFGDFPLEIFAGVAAAGAAVVAAEIWFRGLVHGLLSLDHPIQYPGSETFVSRANAISALAYASCAALLAAPWLPIEAGAELGVGFGPQLAAVAAASVAAGLLLGSIRERSLSLGACIGLQLVGVLACAALWIQLGL